MANSTPNILLIQADQLKPQILRGYGGMADTPHLDRLCDLGVLFENAYCNFPLCAPSRFSMLAGMLPSRIDAFDNAAEYPAQIPTVAHYLRLAGYHTCLAGKQHFVGPDMLHGFHERLVPEIYPTDFSWTPSWDETGWKTENDSRSVTRSGVCVRSVQIDHDEAVLYRSKAKLHDYARGDGQPFFLVSSFTHPHEPYFCMQQYWDRYCHNDIPMPTTNLQPKTEREIHTDRVLRQHSLLDNEITEEHVRTARHSYLANVSYFDDMVGSLLDTLIQTGLSENTILLITSDHGDMLGEHGLWFKNHFFDHCARVPLIFYGPGHFSPKRCPENVSLVDLLPTICGIAGLDADQQAPQPLDGKSLLPLCSRPSGNQDRPVFAEITSECVPSPMLMVRSDKYKLIMEGQAPTLLYNLIDDPEERSNEAENPRMKKIRTRLEAHATSCWDVRALDEKVRLSQRRRHLVYAAHQKGLPPVWDHNPDDPTIPWVHRGLKLYNDWAWQGIDSKS